MQLSEDQIQLRDALRVLLDERVNPGYRMERANTLRTSDPALVSALNELGFIEGFCGDTPTFQLSDLAVVAFEFGRSLLPESYLDGLILGAVASSLPQGWEKNELSLLSSTGAIAPPNGSKLEITSAPDPSSHKALLTGTLSGVRTLPHSSAVIAWSKEGANSAFVIPLQDNGISSSEMPSLDRLSSFNELKLQSAPALQLSQETSRRVLFAVETMVANELAGISSYVIDLTSNYIKTRQQFGVPIGGFQALQHSLASSYVESESLRALASFASWTLTASPSQTPLTALTALMRATSVTPTICERSIQSHGGIGFTWEYELHLYLRRARSLSAQWALNDRGILALLEEVGRASGR
jgi:acyl-CoA dehydrogenase